MRNYSITESELVDDDWVNFNEGEFYEMQMFLNREENSKFQFYEGKAYLVW